MKNMRLIVLTLTLALILACTGCGGAQDTPSQASSSQASSSQSPSSPAPSSQAPSSASAAPSSEESSDSEAEISAELQEIADQLLTTLMGVTEAGETIYYGEAEDFGVLLFYNEAVNQYMSYVGPVTAEETLITITDEDKGKSFTFEMQAAEDGVVLIDTGDSGQAVMAECEPIELVLALDAIATYAGAADAELQEMAAELNSAGMGITETGQTIYFAETDDGMVMVIHDEPANQYLAFVGPATVDGNSVTITDEERGMTFTFTLEDTADGAILINTGDFGQAIIGECDPIDVINALGQVGSQGEGLN